ncbi:Polysaccharide deacetylase [Rhodovulum sp. P5]|uniref:polysaccharide deacetylase family protein n=1 Tax=Rhodovulum sp. P5 TaxID=1564506 RepID=UPI0009C26F29|nr:polysaccharide deacetylase family protein [Rhodovulum sp. P5]ARE40282.1 Polysaccharide deacetylase [Rhodovulum sp. P5]
MERSTAVVNALSFDIEDWFHMVGIAGVDDPATWDALPSILERRTMEILDTLEEKGVRASFFVVGWIADKYPHVIKDIADRGHEISTHSYWHRTVNTLTPEEFAADLDRSIEAIGTASGVRPRGFRAPSFSITPGSEWAFDVLLDAGLVYDASLFPAPRAHGGYPCPLDRHMFTAPSGRKIPELPMSITRILGQRIGFSGGGYLRLLPEPLIRQSIKRMNAEGRPAVVYLHPADFATDRPHVPMSMARKFKTRVGLASTMSKFRALLDNFAFDTCENVLLLAREAKAPRSFREAAPQVLVKV